jgi:hypothetical protein
LRQTLVLVLVFLCLGASLASGYWAPLSPEELLAKSELIVLGELTASDVEGDFGVIRVDEVLKGDSLDSVPLGGRSALVHSAMVTYKVGQKGLWFLRRAQVPANPVYLADHPQRFEAAAGKIAEWKERLHSASPRAAR